MMTWITMLIVAAWLLGAIGASGHLSPDLRRPVRVRGMQVAAILVGSLVLFYGVWPSACSWLGFGPYVRDVGSLFVLPTTAALLFLCVARGGGAVALAPFVLPTRSDSAFRQRCLRTMSEAAKTPLSLGLALSGSAFVWAIFAIPLVSCMMAQ